MITSIFQNVKFWLQFVFLTSVSWRYTKQHAAVIFCAIKKLLKPNNNYIKQYQRLYSHCNLFRLPLPLNRCWMTNATQWLIYNANICFSTIHEAIYLFALRFPFYKGTCTRIPDRFTEVNQSTVIFSVLETVIKLWIILLWRKNSYNILKN